MGCWDYSKGSAAVCSTSDCAVTCRPEVASGLRRLLGCVCLSCRALCALCRCIFANVILTHVEAKNNQWGRFMYVASSKDGQHRILHLHGQVVPSLLYIVVYVATFPVGIWKPLLARLTYQRCSIWCVAGRSLWGCMLA